MIRFIATDVDGTLVKDSAPSIYPEIFDEIKRLTDKGIIFCIASGRQYESVANMFKPVSDRITFLVENGAYIRKGEKELSTIAMDRQDVVEIIEELRLMPDIEIVASSTHAGSILESDNEEFVDMIVNSYHNKTMLVKDILEIDEPIVKIAAYKKENIHSEGNNILIPKWKDRCRCCLAGMEWVDFMHKDADKGNALDFLLKYYHIDREECVAFGDNENDIGMLKTAGIGYAVETASVTVKQNADRICPGYMQRGVLKELQKL